MSLGFINNNDLKNFNKNQSQENVIIQTKLQENNTESNRIHNYKFELSMCKLILLISCIEIVCVSIPLIISVFRLTNN